MARHEQLCETTGITIYLADPHSPWQRGRNENTNGLLRQYMPKGTDLAVFSKTELDGIA
ncbi:MAG: IS30 family transposase [Burkholderia sp.]